jgi:hypothetical protein
MNVLVQATGSLWQLGPRQREIHYTLPVIIPKTGTAWDLINVDPYDSLLLGTFGMSW